MSSSEHLSTTYQRDRNAKLTPYLEGLSEYDQEIAESIAEQLYDPHKPLADTLVIIPVEVATEESTVGPALAQYAKQQTRYPFSLILGFNVDDDIYRPEDPGIVRCLENAQKAQNKFPHLDIRSSYMAYAGNIRQGALKRDLWNGVVRARQKQGPFPANRELLGIGHDIDATFIPRHYIGAIQEHYYGNGGIYSLPVYTQMRHGADPSHPNVSRYVSWVDYTDEQNGHTPEGATVIPLNFYAEHGGFGTQCSTNEVNTFLEGRFRTPTLRTGYLITSPRRYVDRLVNSGPADIWTPDSFGAGNECRYPDVMAGRPDADPEFVYESLTHKLDDTYNSMLSVQSRLAMHSILRTITERTISKQEHLAIATLAATQTERKLRRVTNYVLAACTPPGFAIPEIQIASELPHFQKLAKGTIDW